MDVILTDSRLDTRIKTCIFMNVIVPKLEYVGELCEGNVKFVKKFRPVRIAAAEKILGYSRTM